MMDWRFIRRGRMSEFLSLILVLVLILGAMLMMIGLLVRS